MTEQWVTSRLIFICEDYETRPIVESLLKLQSSSSTRLRPWSVTLNITIITWKHSTPLFATHSPSFALTLSVYLLSIFARASRKRFAEDPRLYNPTSLQKDANDDNRFGHIHTVPVGTVFSSRSAPLSGGFMAQRILILVRVWSQESASAERGPSCKPGRDCWWEEWCYVGGLVGKVRRRRRYGQCCVSYFSLTQSHDILNQLVGVECIPAQVIPVNRRIIRIRLIQD